MHSALSNFMSTPTDALVVRKEVGRGMVKLQPKHSFTILICLWRIQSGLATSQTPSNAILMLVMTSALRLSPGAERRMMTPMSQEITPFMFGGTSTTARTQVTRRQWVYRHYGLGQSLPWQFTGSRASLRRICSVFSILGEVCQQYVWPSGCVIPRNSLRRLVCTFTSWNSNASYIYC